MRVKASARRFVDEVAEVNRPGFREDPALPWVPWSRLTGFQAASVVA